jgi:hypothetical protein
MNGGTSLRLVDKAHPVPLFGPAVPSGGTGTTLPWLNLAMYNHVAFEITGTNAGSGVTGSAITLFQAQDVSGTNATPLLTLVQNWQNLATAPGNAGYSDTLVNVPLGSPTFTLSATASTSFLYYIEVDTAELTTGFSTIQIQLANAAAQTVTVVAYLTGSRVGGGINHYPTALS